MPNRVIREGMLTSERINRLSCEAERFYRRLQQVADDFGRYTANSSLIMAACFPLKLDTSVPGHVREQDILEWLRECENEGLIEIYENQGKRFIEVLRFHQRTRIMKCKWLLRTDEQLFKQADGQMAVIRRSSDSYASKQDGKPPENDKMTVIRQPIDALNPNPNPNPKGEGKDCPSSDGHVPVFEPVPRGLYQREYQTMIDAAKAEIKRIQADKNNYAKDLRDDVVEIVAYLRSKPGEDNEARIKVMLDDPASYARTNPKPKTTQVLTAWRDRIAEITRAMNGVLP